MVDLRGCGIAFVRNARGSVSSAPLSRVEGGDGKGPESMSFKETIHFIRTQLFVPYMIPVLKLT